MSKPDKVDKVCDVVFEELKQEFQGEDYNMACMWMTYVVQVLQADYNIIGQIAGHPVIVVNGMPLKDKRFCRVLHIVANSFELLGDKE